MCVDILNHVAPIAKYRRLKKVLSTTMSKLDRRGFTLIELLVVIAILGTLAAVVVLNVTKYISSGRTEAQATERANVQVAVMAYMADHPAVTTFPGVKIGPGGAGILAPYFINSPNCTYNIPAGGTVPNGTNCDGTSSAVVSPVKKTQPDLDVLPVTDSSVR